MRARLRSLLPLLLALPLLVSCASQDRPELLGVAPGDHYDSVVSHLEKIAELNNELLGEAGGKQVWTLDDGPWESLMIRYGKGQKVKYVTVWQRDDSDEKLRYSDLGLIDEANVVEGMHYRWRLPLDGSDRDISLTARGEDPDYPRTISLHWAVPLTGPDGAAVNRKTL